MPVQQALQNRTEQFAQGKNTFVPDLRQLVAQVLVAEPIMMRQVAAAAKFATLVEAVLSSMWRLMTFMPEALDKFNEELAQAQHLAQQWIHNLVAKDQGWAVTPPEVNLEEAAAGKGRPKRKRSEMAGPADKIGMMLRETRNIITVCMDVKDQDSQMDPVLEHMKLNRLSLCLAALFFNLSRLLKALPSEGCWRTGCEWKQGLKEAMHEVEDYTSAR